MGASLISAPPIEAERWFNTDRPLALDMFLGKVVVLHAFQMLCPGCVSHAIPQARRLHEIDRPSPSGPIPVTMAAYGFKGTPTTVVIDREGRIVRQTFGAEDDLVLGLVLGSLLSSKLSAP